MSDFVTTRKPNRIILTMPYPQFTKEDLKLALAHYKATKVIQDVLLVCFDQHGKWRCHPFPHDGVDSGKLPKQTIPANHLVKFCPNGQKILLCSFVDCSETPIELDYHHVAGHISTANTQHFSAPNLQTVGGYLDANSATSFNAPCLQTVNGNLGVFSVNSFNVPCLLTVNGTLMAGIRTTFDAPKLQTVTGDLDTESATSFKVTDLQTVNGHLNAQSANFFDAPNLQNVGGDLTAELATSFLAPSLETVGSDLNAPSATTFHAPRLVTVGGDLALNEITMRAAVSAGCPAAIAVIAEGL